LLFEGSGTNQVVRPGLPQDILRFAWFPRASKMFHPEPRKGYGFLPPFVPFGSPVGSKVFGSRCRSERFHSARHLAYAYVPPQASLTFSPRFCLMSLVDPKATYRSASLKLSRPFAFIKN